MHTVNQYLSVFDNSYEVVYQYNGLLKHNIITKILNDLKKLLKENYVIFKKIYAVSNELLENAFYHAQQDKNEVDYVLIQNNSKYRIVIFNYLNMEQFELFSKKIEKVNKPKLDEIKKDYQKQLLTGKINEKGTIGIGLELVRLKTKNKILFSFQEIQDDLLVIIDVGIDKE